MNDIMEIGSGNPADTAIDTIFGSWQAAQQLRQGQRCEPEIFISVLRIRMMIKGQHPDTKL